MYERNDPYYSGASVKSSGDVVSTTRSAAKEKEALSVVSKEYIESRGGINAQGYYNDVPAYQQLTANERASVTLPNGSINTAAMLAILNQKEAQYKGTLFSGYSSAGGSASITTVDPTPPIIMPTSIVASPVKAPVKTATPDIVLFKDDLVPIETMTDLIFENIGGQELINIARSDTINGQEVTYTPIKNLSSIQQQYNSKNIVSIYQTSDKYFAGFAIKLENKIPNVGNGVNGENVYIDAETGSLIIETVNLEEDEQVEVEIAINGTIYETET